MKMKPDFSKVGYQANGLCPFCGNYMKISFKMGKVVYCRCKECVKQSYVFDISPTYLPKIKTAG